VLYHSSNPESYDWADQSTVDPLAGTNPVLYTSLRELSLRQSSKFWTRAYSLNMISLNEIIGIYRERGVFKSFYLIEPFTLDNGPSLLFDSFINKGYRLKSGQNL
jgi:hypothetical protein